MYRYITCYDHNSTVYKYMVNLKLIEWDSLSLLGYIFHTGCKMGTRRNEDYKWTYLIMFLSYKVKYKKMM